MLDTVLSLDDVLASYSDFVNLLYPFGADPPCKNEKTEASTTDAKTPEKEKKPEPTGYLIETHFGIWKIYEYSAGWKAYLPGWAFIQSFQATFACLPYIKRFMLDLWSLAPFLCIAYAAGTFLQGILPSVSLHYSAAGLELVEKAFSEKKLDRDEITWAVMGRVICSIVSWAITFANSRIQLMLEQRIKYHFNRHIMAAQLRLDLPTISQDSVKAKIDAAHRDTSGWTAFQSVIDVVSMVIEVSSQAFFLYHTLKNQSQGSTIAALCLVKPILANISYSSYITMFYAVVTNEHYLRMKRLFDFVEDKSYRREIISNGMGTYIQQAYDASRALFGDTVDGNPWDRPRSGFIDFLNDVFDDFPLIYLAYRLVQAPESFPLTSISLVQKTTQGLTWSLYRVTNNTGTLLQAFTSIKSLYEIESIENTMKDGDTSYPIAKVEPLVKVEDKDAAEKSEIGMKVEFRKVSFKYPNTDKVVINDLSFTLEPGSLCVIVGENGCGKSSTVNLLARVYDPTEGEIFIDDHPLTSLRSDDFRKATAVMYQSYLHFPFPLRENIGLGRPELAHDIDAVKEAARLGGALDFIEEMAKGFDTSLEGNNSSCSSGDAPKGSKLEEAIKNAETQALDLSGGQTQRLALSRTFMRSTSSQVRLLAYDEPSAALDPKAEFELFERLRNLRGKKTMIFITHRFGYLTKHADHIIYMDKGSAIEQGTHDELLAKNGPYAQLYNVQAQAFSST